MNKKGIYYSMDALLAGILFVSIVLILFQNSFYEPEIEQKNFLAQDLLGSLGAINLGDVTNNPMITTELASEQYVNANNTVLELIGIYWALNQTDNATKLLTYFINGTIPDQLYVQLTLDSDELYPYQNSITPTTIVSGRRMITGIAQGKPLTGFSSSAYLKKVRNKKTSSYAYLGGFVGQGNIIFYLDNIPNGISSEKIIDMHLEGDYAGNFTFKINNISCGGTYYSNLISGVIDSWDLSSCNSSITSGRNILEIIFTSDIEDSYVSGGYFEINYRTDDLQQNLNDGFNQYFFPGVDGIANVYDSFYIPGQLTNMALGIHFNSSQKTYVSIGERVIEINGTGDDQWHFISNSQLLTNYSFDYTQLSVNTVPIRFASYNETIEEVVVANADIVLITDFSGSMKKAVDSWTQGTGLTDCEELYTFPDARKTHLAKCLDNELVDIVMNYSGNRLWPVFLHDDDISYYNNPEDKDAIKGYISNFGPQGKDKTCLSCAINKAYDILNTYSSENRTKTIVLMTDGAPTHCADGSCTSTSSIYGNLVCAGFCDTNGASGCSASDKEGCDIGDLSCEPAESNTLYAAQRAVDDLNVTFFSVGFGLIEDCSRAGILLQDIADMNNGTYQHSKNVTELRIIYENISNEILSTVTQVNQSVTVQGGLVSSTLYPDSYVNFTYDPLIGNLDPGKMSLVFQEPLTSCTQNINIPIGVEVVDAKVISYSGTSWSDILVVNGETVFNLSDYYVPYYKLGDPLVIQVPITNITNGNNLFFVDTGSSPENRSGCSVNNSFIYTALINASTPRSETYEVHEGCSWTVESEVGSFSTLDIPNDYVGTNTCFYTGSNIIFNPLDAYDSATNFLLKQLDPDGNGKIIVDLAESDLEITITLVSGIPYLWGPALIGTQIGS